MMLYDHIQTAMNNRDVQSYLDLLHDDFIFVRHQTGTEVTKEEWVPTLTMMMESTALEIHNDRCIYENDDILVTHQVMKFPDGTSEAVMIVNMKKDGKVIRSETGATPVA